jgi:hypothetical protein
MNIRIPAEIREKLLANGRDADADHAPLLKLYTLGAAFCWLISEMQPYDEDILFGLCDLGFGFPELGTLSLSEIEAVTEELGVIVLQDHDFVGRYPLSVYAEAARQQQAITVIPSLLDAAAERLGARRSNSGLH